MELVCEVCDATVYSFRGTSETRCLDCEMADEDGGHAERMALRLLVHDSHEKGRGKPPPQED